MRVFFIRKRHILIGLIVFILLSVGLGIAANLDKIVYRYSKLHKVVVVDAGHGSIDPGAHYGDLKEKDLNLQIAFILKEVLEKANMEVVMTRTDDSLYKKSRREDIKYRPRKANEVNADVFVSIHCNKYPSPEPYGGQAYYYSGEQSKFLAEQIQVELEKIQPGNRRSIGRGNYYVLKKTECPAVLIEVGFLSSAIDRKRLQDPNEQRQVANAIRDGLISFFHNQFAEGTDEVEETEEIPQDEVTHLSEGFNLYFASSTPEGERLKKVHKPLPTEKVLAVSNKYNNLTFLERVAVESIEQLIAGPEDETLAPVMPPGTELKSISIKHGRAVLNFNSELVENHWGGAAGEKMTIESIVRTLTTLPGIDQVEILINGEKGKTIAGHIILDEPIDLNILH